MTNNEELSRFMRLTANARRQAIALRECADDLDAAEERLQSWQLWLASIDRDYGNHVSCACTLAFLSA